MRRPAPTTAPRPFLPASAGNTMQMKRLRLTLSAVFFVNFHLARFVAWLIYLLQLFLKAFKLHLGHDSGHGRRGSVRRDGVAAVARPSGGSSDATRWPVVL